MGLYYKNCHSHLPWAAQQQSNTGRAMSPVQSTSQDKQIGRGNTVHVQLSDVLTESSQLKEVCLRTEEIIAIPWHGLVQKWGKRFMFWFDQSALHIWCKILISCSTEIYTMSKGKYSATFMLFSLGWESWRMTNSARFLLHLFPNESSLTGVAFAQRALLVRGVIFFPFLFLHSTIPPETEAQRQLYHRECFCFCSLLYSGNWQKLHHQRLLLIFSTTNIYP